MINNTVQNGRIIKFAKISSVKMIFGRIRESLLPRKFPAIRYNMEANGWLIEGAVDCEESKQLAFVWCIKENEGGACRLGANSSRNSHAH